MNPRSSTRPWARTLGPWLVALGLFTSSCGRRSSPSPSEAGPGPRVAASVVATDAAPEPSAIVGQVMAFLRDAVTFGPNELSAAALIGRHAGGVDGGAAREIGLGATVATHPIHDARVSCELAVIGHEGLTVIAAATCAPVSDAAWPGVKAELVHAGGLYVRYASTRTVRLMWKHELRFVGLAERVAPLLGYVGALDVPSELVPEYDELSLPLRAESAFGLACGEDGAKPEGAVALDTLLAKKRVDIVRAVARGLSPEGRVYAARALQELGDPNDRELVRRISNMSTPARACFGCTYMMAPPGELVRADLRKCPSCAPPSLHR